MNAASIKMRINFIVDDYKNWHIGLTQRNPSERRKEHENDGDDVSRWTFWEADTFTDAQDIERHFKNDCGMEGGTGGDLTPDVKTYVYIY